MTVDHHGCEVDKLSTIAGNVKHSQELKDLNQKFDIVKKGYKDNHGKANKHVEDIEKYYDSENYKLAHLNFSKAIERSPKHTAMYYYRGLAKYKMTNYKGAIKDYNKALQLSPGFDKALFKRGLAKIKAKDYASAMKDYDQAIKQNPQNGDAYFNRGLAKKLMKKPHCDDWKKAADLGNVNAASNIEKCK